MIEKIRDNISKYFVGNEKAVKDICICLLAGGHILIEDVPGVGKTTLAKTLAKTIDASFGRIQFTPDTLPSDITGVTVYNTKNGEFEYKEGAIMKEIILADEINRTSPKTQAAMLEAMAEKQVTVDGKAHRLPEFFMVIATENPLDFIGTYKLPEASMDRFMMKISLGYPGEADEIALAKNALLGIDVSKAQAVAKVSDIEALMEDVKKVFVSDAIYKYAENIISLTRESKDLSVGASPRAMIHLLLAARANALIEGRDFVKPDDVKSVSVNVLHHRLSLNREAIIRKENIDKVINALVIKAKIPME